MVAHYLNFMSILLYLWPLELVIYHYLAFLPLWLHLSLRKKYTSIPDMDKFLLDFQYEVGNFMKFFSKAGPTMPSGVSSVQLVHEYRRRSPNPLNILGYFFFQNIAQTSNALRKVSDNPCTRNFVIKYSTNSCPGPPCA